MISEGSCDTEKWRVLAAENSAQVKSNSVFTAFHNYRHFEMTTRDVQLSTVHVLGLGIICFYSNSQHNEPV